jgi:hypothetical protein
MPEIPNSILLTLLEALEVYQGDPEQIHIARTWLSTYYSLSRMSLEEATQINAELARIEAEDDEANDRTLEEVEAEIFKMIANFDVAKEKVEA